jgi:biotin carboxyl carrier protein
LTFQLPFSIKHHSLTRTGRRAWPKNKNEGEEGMSKKIVAPMPGKVIDILVKMGDEVLEYQEVLVLEAMKMENAILSPESGKVKDPVKKDYTVTAKQVLIELE